MLYPTRSRSARSRKASCLALSGSCRRNQERQILANLLLLWLLHFSPSQGETALVPCCLGTGKNRRLQPMEIVVELLGRQGFLGRTKLRVLAATGLAPLLGVVDQATSSALLLSAADRLSFRRICLLVCMVGQVLRRLLLGLLNSNAWVRLLARQ